MRIIEGGREHIYKLLAEIYKHIQLKPIMAEVGVLKGKNAKNLVNILSPSKLYLIDSWSAAGVDSYRATNSHRAWVDDPKEVEFYYGGPLDSQATYDQILQEAKDLLEGEPAVEFIKSESLQGAQTLKSRGIQLDYIYIDANHAYENVLDDLMFYSELLTPQIGCIQVNDCCFSELGVKQNLGVLEAATKFCRLRGFLPVLAVNRDFTDVLLVPANSDLVTVAHEVVLNSDLASIEVPDSLFPNLQVQVGKRPHLSFV